MKDFIRVYDNVLDADECSHYINLIENNPKKMGHFRNPEGISISDSSVKLSEDINISVSFPHEVEKLLHLFCNALSKYEEDIEMQLNVFGCEHFVGRVYRKDKGHYSTHIDCHSKENIRRTLTMLLYLNTINKGGELVFPDFDKTIQTRQGRLVLFPSYWMYRHGSNIPLDNDRYMIRTFMNLINDE